MDYTASTEPLFAGRICPRCGTRFETKAEWVARTHIAGHEDRPQAWDETRGGLVIHQRGMLRLVIREHSGCGGQMYSPNGEWHKEVKK